MIITSILINKIEEDSSVSIRLKLFINMFNLFCYKMRYINQNCPNFFLMITPIFVSLFEILESKQPKKEHISSHLYKITIKLEDLNV